MAEKENGGQPGEQAVRQNREKIIVRTSVIGILANVVLAAFKAVVGLVSHSIAVTLDAVNNLSDALSSLITIAGTKLAAKAPDKKHPFGYGRLEYMSALIVAAIVLYAGITSLTESIRKIIHPQAAEYSVTTLVILAAAIAVKIVLGRFVTRKGKEVDSGSLIASGSDASFDAVLSAAVFGSAILYLATGVRLEAWVSAVISVVIIKSGLEMIRDAVDDMLGIRASADLTRGIRALAEEEPGVYGVYDLILHNYGPDRYLASFHVEVDDTATAADIDRITRKLQEKILRRYPVILTAVGVYPRNTQDDEAAAIRDKVHTLVSSHDEVLQMHGFYVNIPDKRMIFDVIVDFSAGDRQAVVEKIRREVQEAFPDYRIHITLDSDVSD